jgi:predicted site-specific integrase-resolvase
VAWIVRYLSVVGVKVEILREHGDTSLVEELMDDFMAVLASFSGRFTDCGRSGVNVGFFGDAPARWERG